MVVFTISLHLWSLLSLLNTCLLYILSLWLPCAFCLFYTCSPACTLGHRILCCELYCQHKSSQICDFSITQSHTHTHTKLQTQKSFCGTIVLFILHLHAHLNCVIRRLLVNSASILSIVSGIISSI